MNSSLKKNRKFPLIRRELVRLYGKERAQRIIDLAEERYAECARICSGAPEGERMHLDGTILPTAAVYKALQQEDPDHALTNTHALMMNLCAIGGAMMRALLHIPGMKGLFMRILPDMAESMFGEACGFAFRGREVSRDALKMDMTACPYCRHTALLGCPELMYVFCDSDVAVYGNLPGIRFERTKTLGTGGDCCDFRFTRVR